MILDRHPDDYCYKVGMETRAHCSGCGKPIAAGEVAWSYLPCPVDGNYVEHENCRYGHELTYDYPAKFERNIAGGRLIALFNDIDDQGPEGVVALVLKLETSAAKGAPYCRYAATDESTQGEMTMTHTRQSVSDFLLARTESDLPEQILQALQSYTGKMVTTRILDKLPGGKDEWRLRRQYGMTHIENNAYWRTSGSAENGISLLLAHTEASFPFDAADMVKRNPAYFDGRKNRNHKRMEARNDAAKLDSMAAVLNRMERAAQELQNAWADLETLTEYGSSFAPDKYTFERLVGVSHGHGELRDSLVIKQAAALRDSKAA